MPNLLFGWIWILAGFLSGMFLGLRFQDEAWLGGYGSHPRRMVRLGHISFLGLGFVNILFALCAGGIHLAPRSMSVASTALVIGAVSMPACCALMAWRRGMQPLFAVPVASLVLGAVLAVTGMLRP